MSGLKIALEEKALEYLEILGVENYEIQGFIVTLDLGELIILLNELKKCLELGLNPFENEKQQYVLVQPVQLQLSF